MGRGLLALSGKRYRAAEKHFLAAVELHQHVRHTVRLTYPRLALATLYHRWGRTDEALDQMSASLADIRQQGKPGIVLQEGHSIAPLLELALDRGVEREMAGSLLAIFDRAAAPRSIAIPDSVESLTPREAEVLRLLATGASNRAIAGQLVITERTVKAHVSQVLAKLEVASRTEAVARARQLHLL